MARIKEITRVEPQKRNKKRRSIFLDGEFAFGVDEELIYKYELYEGSRINLDTVGKILEEEEFKRALDKALRFLAYRARSEKEMRDKLVQSGYDEDTIVRVITILKEKKYINDKEFASLFVRERLRLRPSGQYLLKHELKQKGIPEEIVNNTLADIFSEYSQTEIARDLIRKKENSYRNLEPNIRRKRLTDFLLRRGFDWDIVAIVMEEWQNESNDLPG
ncbi:RecX family transcriptional regulator [candidate division KSB1 bacterium]|nr:RecX family transcriptional regulator [candidate division KSB1 bacterium]